MKTIKLHAKLHCGSCEGKIKSALDKKVEEVLVNVASGLIKIKYDESKIELNTIKETIQDLGYELV
ncbi:heavy-metal-associated domain-containing protein [Mycoplasma todarodis]|uniref:Copper resistance protein CopZ n=1 Tax=Mycoplasma todarodis TaxID=1937191 RepID=A0A4R0XND5_9MOLU|nr:heavy metal-associated domain-containing protein [Mycoplasma todarodis]TCG10992.1 copper resistance protein CopZ [Mycoplasma todarodis]